MEGNGAIFIEKVDLEKFTFGKFVKQNEFRAPIDHKEADMMQSIITLKARLILYHFNQILLLQQTKLNGGNYTLVGGTIEAQEFAKEALVRETKEEAGIKIEADDLELAHVLHKRSKSEHRIVFYFITNRWEGNLQALETHKFKSVKWFPIDQLPKNLTGTVRHVLKHYQKGKKYSEFYKK